MGILYPDGEWVDYFIFVVFENENWINICNLISFWMILLYILGWMNYFKFLTEIFWFNFF